MVHGSMLGIDPVILAAGIAVMTFVVGRIIWGWLVEGRIKGSFTTTSHCEDLRKSCCLPKVKKDIGVLESQAIGTEKTLDQNREDLHSIQAEVSKIKESVAGIEVSLNSLLLSGRS